MLCRNHASVEVEKIYLALRIVKTSIQFKTQIASYQGGVRRTRRSQAAVTPLE